MADGYEQTLLIIKECFVFKIPPRSTAAGYKAADWDLQHPLWTGRLVISSKGDTAYVKMESNSGEIFAVCPVKDNLIAAIEPVTDSSRYFVVRIEDRGKHAFIGLGFLEKNDAFDFNVALQDHVKYVKQADSRNASKSNQPKLDLSLKEGQTITVNIKTKAGSTPTKTQTSANNPVPFLRPPPGSRQAQTYVSNQGVAIQQPNNTFIDPNAQQPVTQNPPSPSSILWGDFVESNQTQPQIQTQNTINFNSNQFGNPGSPVLQATPKQQPTPQNNNPFSGLVQLGNQQNSPQQGQQQPWFLQNQTTTNQTPSTQQSAGTQNWFL